jgi:hypothetical protein
MNVSAYFIFIYTTPASFYLGLNAWIEKISVVDPWHFGTYPDADPGGPKTFGSYGFGSGIRVHLHNSSKIKSHKEVTKQ